MNTTVLARSFVVGGKTIAVSAAPARRVVRPRGRDGGVLQVAGNALSADEFDLQKDGATVSVSGTNLGLLLQAGDDAGVADFRRFVRRDVQPGRRIRGGGERDGRGPSIAGLAVSGVVSLQFNTTASAQTVTVAGSAVAIPAASGGTFVRLIVDRAALTVSVGGLDNALTADRFTFQSDGSAGVTVGGTNVAFAFAAAGRASCRCPAATSASRSPRPGVFGAITGASVQGPDLGGTLALSGTVALWINTTGVAQAPSVGGTTINLPAGPYVRAEVTGGALDLVGIHVTANRIAFQRTADANGQAAIQLEIDNARFALGDGRMTWWWRPSTPACCP